MHVEYDKYYGSYAVALSRIMSCRNSEHFALIRPLDHIRLISKLNYSFWIERREKKT